MTPGPLALDFMRTAYAAAAVVGLVGPLVGLLLIERRLSLIGDGLGHVAFAGVGFGLVLGINPVLTGLVAAVAGGLAVEWLRTNRITAGDRALALLFYTGLAAGVVLISMSSGLTGNVHQYLFGSILTISRTDLTVTALMGLAALAVVTLLWRPLTGIAIDQEGAEVAGVPVGRLNLIVAVLAAVTVASSIQTVGVLLIGALMVLPVMTSSLVAWSLRSTAVLGSLIGLAIAVVGLTLSYYANSAPGGTIALTASAVYLAVLVISLTRGTLR
jgi:zinc transport system permease protein